MKINNNPQTHNQPRFGMKLSAAQEKIYPALAKKLQSIYPLDTTVSVDYFCKQTQPYKYSQGVILGHNNKIISTIEKETNTFITPDKIMDASVLPKSHATFEDYVIKDFKLLSQRIKAIEIANSKHSTYVLKDQAEVSEYLKNLD